MVLTSFFFVLTSFNKYTRDKSEKKKAQKFSRRCVSDIFLFNAEYVNSLLQSFELYKWEKKRFIPK